MIDNLCIFSYNSRGFSSSKQEFLKTLLLLAGNSMSVICNQENFILNANEYIIRNALPDHHIFFNAAQKEHLDGRPRNGMFVAIPETMKEMVKDVSPKSDRIQSLLFKIESCSILLINTYFPIDPKSDNFDDSELQLVLHQIKETIHSNEFDQVIWTGDINADFKRNSHFVNIVDDFITELDLRKAWDKHDIDFTHTYERNNTIFTSTIDHFILSQPTESCVLDAGVIHHPENLSDHCPIFCKLSIPNLNRESTSNYKIPNNLPNWRKADLEEKRKYFQEVENRLMELNLPDSALNCSDVKCINSEHKTALDDTMLNIMQTMESCMNDTIPKKQWNEKNSKRKLPEWKEEVTPLKEKAIFWHAVWVSAGRPMNCILHTIMKKTRNCYHLCIRRKKRLLDRLKKDNLLAACIDNDKNLFDIF